MGAAELIEQTTGVLGELTIGERFWFWLCPDLDAEQPAFLAQPLAADLGMAQLKNQTRQLTVPVGASPIIGMGSVRADGRLSMASPLIAPEHLTGLAGWVKRVVEAHPTLARLKGATLLNISAQGIVRRIFSSPTLWEGVPDVVAPGTLGETAARLGRLKAGRSCWFWLAQHGPADAPFLYLYPARRDPQGEAFAGRILDLRRRASRRGAELKGLAQKTEAGTLMLVTTDDVAPGRALLEDITEACPALELPLAAAVLMRSEGDRFMQVVLNDVEAEAAEADLSAQAAVLQTLGEPGRKAMFWMGTADGSPTLLLASSGGGLKAAVSALETHGRSTRGTVVVSGKGWLEFRARRAYPGFITDLAAWAAVHRSRWPILARLDGARMTQRNADGEIIDRQRDDAAWTAT